MNTENIKDKLANVWIEKYRPKTINELAVSKEVRMFIEDIINKNDLPNLLLFGNAGTGKNSIVNVIINSIDCNYIILNASSDTGIDTIREEIETFAKSSSWGNKIKIVILNEADGLSFASQNALKEVMETTLKNCRFIITTNNYNKINPAIISRCTEFKIEAPKMEIVKRLTDIFDSEYVVYTPQYLNCIIHKYNTNIRKMIGESYKYFKIYGDLKSEYITNNIDDNIIKIFDLIFKTKSIKEINKIINTSIYFDDEYSMLKEYCIDKYNNPDMVIIIMDYLYKSNIVHDKDLCLLSCILEIKDIIDNKK